MAVTDAELARAAARGDAASLGALLQRHHASLRGLAVTFIGHDDAEDVVHDAFLVALRSIGDLRDPTAARGWLHAIVRTQCLMRLRAGREVATDGLYDLAGSVDDGSPEEELERLALRDWVWSALEQLTEPLRVVAILRYFGTRSSYEEIAAILGVPVGTVRSRLNQVRLRLADRLLAEASSAHPDIARRQAASERLFHEAIDRVNRLDFDCFAYNWAEDIEGHGPGGELWAGRAEVLRMLHYAPAVGVRISLERVIASSAITVLDFSLENPPEAPDYSPPATTHVHLHPRGRTNRILWASSPRPNLDPRPSCCSPT